MKLSVKDSAGLVAYWTFDNGLGSDVTNNVNNGILKGGANVIADNTSPSFSVVATDYTFGFDYSLPESCDVPATASTTPIEHTPKNEFGGVVVRVEKCLQKPNLTEVVIDPCGTVKPITAQINSAGPNGESIPKETLSGQIKINIRDGYQVIPKVGDMVLGRAVDDKALTCTSLVSGEAVSIATHVGTVTGAMGDTPDTEGKCGNVSGGKYSSFFNRAGGLTGHAIGYTLMGAVYNIGAEVLGLPTTGEIGHAVGKAIDKIFKW